MSAGGGRCLPGEVVVQVGIQRMWNTRACVRLAAPLRPRQIEAAVDDRQIPVLEPRGKLPRSYERRLRHIRKVSVDWRKVAWRRLAGPARRQGFIPWPRGRPRATHSVAFDLRAFR